MSAARLPALDPGLSIPAPAPAMAGAGAATATLHGHLRLRAEPRDDGSTVLAAQAFRAPFHLSKPYFDPVTRTLLVQVVNPTAGILAGDHLESDVTVAHGAALLLTTPSASRVFRMRDGGAAASTQRFNVEAGGWLEVLPEPLVPHRGSTFQQHTHLAVAPGGAAFYADLLLPGRIAHGETWGWDRLRLALEVRVAGALVLRERFEHSGEGLRALARLAGSGDTACFGNAVLLMPGTASAAAPATPAWREALHALHVGGVWIGVSPLPGGAGWSLKFVTPDALRLRDTLHAIRGILAPHVPRLACDARKL